MLGVDLPQRFAQPPLLALALGSRRVPKSTNPDREVGHPAEVLALHARGQPMAKHLADVLATDVGGARGVVGPVAAPAVVRAVLAGHRRVRDGHEAVDAYVAFAVLTVRQVHLQLDLGDDEVVRFNLRVRALAGVCVPRGVLALLPRQQRPHVEEGVAAATR